MLHADGQETQPGGHAHQRAGEQLHQHITLNLVMDLVERLQSDSLFAQCRSCEFDQLAAEAVSGRHQEKADQCHHAGLPGKRYQSQRSVPQVVFDVESGFLNLHPLHAARRCRNPRGFLGGLLQFSRCLLYCDQRVVGLAGQGLNGIA